MLENRNLKLDVLALALLVMSVVLALSLFTYDPADPPSDLVYPARAEVANVCGKAGALLAHGLLSTLGLGSFYLLVSLLTLVSLMLTSRHIQEPVLRSMGWLLSLAGFTALVAMAAPGLSFGPTIGPGGYLGAAVRGGLETHFATVGAYVLVLSIFASGLLLCTDYVLIRVSAWILGKPAVGVGRGLKRAVGPLKRRVDTAQATVAGGRSLWDEDVAELDDAYDADEVEVPVKSAAFAAGADAEEEDEYEEYEEETETEEAEEEEVTEAAAPRGVASRIASALRIKTPTAPKQDEREEMLVQLEAASHTEGDFDYELPSLDLLLESEEFNYDQQQKDIRRQAKILEKTFTDFGFNVKVVEIETGPVIAQFEVELEAGLRLSKITSLADDLAIALRVPSVRIVAPIPGKNTVGIEIPNRERQLVRLREVIEQAAGPKLKKMAIPIFLGKDVSGKPLVADLASLPHLLIAGRTGTGKSVCLNTIITSMLMTRRPDEVRMLMIDPKMVELSPYKSLPHLMHPVVTDMKKAEAILGWAVDKMEERYALLARAGVRHITSYNQLGEDELFDRMQVEDDEERAQIPTHLPFIVIVADEMADLMMTSAKEVEQHIIRLAQKSRAVGIHLVLATQKPTVDVITGLIKSNLPARIAFQVASRTDSRVVLDEMGADKLLGNGDMLFLWPGTSMLLRGQGTYISDDEINAVIDAVGTTEQQFVRELVQLQTGDDAASGAGPSGIPNRDELYEAAIDVVVREQRGSCSLLQRALGIGYGRAARLIDFMAEDGFVGQYNGSQARDVLLTPEQWAQMQAGGDAAPPAAAPSDPPLTGGGSKAVRRQDPPDPPKRSPKPPVTAHKAEVSRKLAAPRKARFELEDEAEEDDEDLFASRERDYDDEYAENDVEEYDEDEVDDDVVAEDDANAEYEDDAEEEAEDEEELEAADEEYDEAEEQADEEEYDDGEFDEEADEADEEEDESIAAEDDSDCDDEEDEDAPFEVDGPSKVPAPRGIRPGGKSRRSGPHEGRTTGGQHKRRQAPRWRRPRS